MPIIIRGDVIHTPMMHISITENKLGLGLGLRLRLGLGLGMICSGWKLGLGLGHF